MIFVIFCMRIRLGLKFFLFCFLKYCISMVVCFEIIFFRSCWLERYWRIVVMNSLR